MEHIIYIGLVRLGRQGQTLWRKSTETLRSLWMKRTGKIALLSTLGSCGVVFIIYKALRKRRQYLP